MKNPLFVRNPNPGADGLWGTEDDDYGDLHLQENSPCIDMGTCYGAPLDDLDGDCRCDGCVPPESSCDMGADEVVSYDIVVPVDIKPGSCPNPVNVKSKGVLPVAILGTEVFDVTTIDPTTLTLSREGIEVSVPQIRYAYEDVATPFQGELCDCHDLNGDGYLDLTIKFNVPALVDTLNLNKVIREIIPLTISGNLKEENGGTEIKGKDCVWVLGHKQIAGKVTGDVQEGRTINLYKQGCISTLMGTTLTDSNGLYLFDELGTTGVIRLNLMTVGAVLNLRFYRNINISQPDSTIFDFDSICGGAEN